MYVTRGEDSGLSVVPTVYGDDWIIAYTPQGRLVVTDPLHVQLCPEDIAWFHEPDNIAASGDFWAVYALSGDHFQAMHASGPGRLVQSGHADLAGPGGTTARTARAEGSPVARRLPECPVVRDSAAGNMVHAVHAGSVVFSPVTGRSGWASSFHSIGFAHLGRSLTGQLWGRVEQCALNDVAGRDLVARYRGAHWGLTLAGRDLYWRWTHSGDRCLA